MTLYISAARRQRRAIGWAVAVGLVTFALGLLLGRQQLPSIDERVSSVQTAAAAIATGVERLDIEYEQVLTADGTDTVQAGVVAPLDALRDQLQRTMDTAPWLTAAQRQTVLDSVADLRAGTLDGISLDDFRTRSLKVGALLRSTFGAV